MNKKFLAGAALAAALLVPRFARAHEGHAHKMMGTVAARQETRLQIKAADGKTADIVLDASTKILRGTTRVTLDDIKPGERIVVTAVEKKGQDGKTTMIATEVKLAPAS